MFLLLEPSYSIGFAYSYTVKRYWWIFGLTFTIMVKGEQMAVSPQKSSLFQKGIPSIVSLMSHRNRFPSLSSSIFTQFPDILTFHFTPVLRQTSNWVRRSWTSSQFSRRHRQMTHRRRRRFYRIFVAFLGHDAAYKWPWFGQNWTKLKGPNGLEIPAFMSTLIFFWHEKWNAPNMSLKAKSASKIRTNLRCLSDNYYCAKCNCKWNKMAGTGLGGRNEPILISAATSCRLCYSREARCEHYEAAAAGWWRVGVIVIQGGTDAKMRHVSLLSTLLVSVCIICMIILMRKQVARVAKTRVANHMAMKSVKRDDMTAKESTNVSSIATFDSNCHYYLQCPKTLYDKHCNLTERIQLFGIWQFFSSKFFG